MPTVLTPARMRCENGQLLCRPGRLRVAPSPAPADVLPPAALPVAPDVSSASWHMADDVLSISVLGLDGSGTSSTSIPHVAGVAIPRSVPLTATPGCFSFVRTWHMIPVTESAHGIPTAQRSTTVAAKVSRAPSLSEPPIADRPRSSPRRRHNSSPVSLRSLL